ncbi:glycosyl hydrolase family 43 [Aureibaculum algae]|uniref:Glycosyl hydrolase family 43 n=1 Tax=Aureibaculum algae TaxID=2584122 RepID=A0A5B7TMC3_9FLAO|nr:glycoside hydrolase family 43 protein [Aureibaculum algae]QCX37418.1 glycosyl hydrolase family 43 [Aureibaculum algae]
MDHRFKYIWYALFFFLIVACKETESEKINLGHVENTFSNPLLPNGPDPWVIFHDNYYFYIRSENRKLILMKTADITDLQNAESHIIWSAPETGNYSKNIWAPEIHFINNNWYIYFAADNGDNRNHRMFVLENTSKNPFEGVFVFKSKIETDKNDNWAIDGSIFEHKNQLYFIWSGWEEPKKENGMEIQNIYIAEMSNPWTISSKRVLISTPEQKWEQKWQYPGVSGPSTRVYVNEGPQMIVHGEKIHIIYSASGCWTPYYSLGLLTAKVNNDLMIKTSWVKSENPVFEQSEKNKVYGPGHNSFFKSPDGTEDWILYHATDGSTDGCSDKRSPRAQEFRWTKDDMPIFGTPVTVSKKLVRPSGI